MDRPDSPALVTRAHSPFADLTTTGAMIRFILVQNRQGKTRLSKWYVPYDDDEKVSYGQLVGCHAPLTTELCRSASEERSTG